MIIGMASYNLGMTANALIRGYYVPKYVGWKHLSHISPIVSSSSSKASDEMFSPTNVNA